jgi:hypothetical protein
VTGNEANGVQRGARFQLPAKVEGANCAVRIDIHGLPTIAEFLERRMNKLCICISMNRLSLQASLLATRTAGTSSAKVERKGVETGGRENMDIACFF